MYRRQINQANPQIHFQGSGGNNVGQETMKS